jgi:hypothetical protein
MGFEIGLVKHVVGLPPLISFHLKHLKDKKWRPVLAEHGTSSRARELGLHGFCANSLDRPHRFIVKMGRAWMLADQTIWIDCRNPDTFGTKQVSESKTNRPTTDDCDFVTVVSMVCTHLHPPLGYSWVDPIDWLQRVSTAAALPVAHGTKLFFEQISICSIVRSCSCSSRASAANRRGSRIRTGCPKW